MVYYTEWFYVGKRDFAGGVTKLDEVHRWLARSRGFGDVPPHRRDRSVRGAMLRRKT
jgi:hypothetical protein